MTDPEMPQEHIPSLDTVAAAYSEVLDHNHKHTGIGIGFGNLLSALLEVESANPDASADEIYAAVNERVNQVATEGDMAGDLQGILHEDTFMRVGIKLAPLGGQMTNTLGERASSTELLPMVDNTELFTDFLAQQKPEDLQENMAALDLTTDIVTTLQETVATYYGKMPEDMLEEQKQALRQYGEDALRTFLRVDQAYQKLGLDNPAVYQHYIAEGTTGYLDDQYQRYQKATGYQAAYKTLEDYVIYWGRGVLPERLETGSMEELAEDKLPYFDGMHDKLTAKVGDIVVLTLAEPTHDFGVEAAQAMLSGIKKTMDEMDNQPEEWFVSDKNRQLLKDLEIKLQMAISPAQA